MTAGRSFDYVVVGGGSGGCAAARLLVDAGARVAVLEAGPAPVNPAIDDPGRWPELLQSDVDWAYLTVPQPGCAGRRLSWSRGRVLGGSGALNGMAYIRGHRLDYDGWAFRGCPGWGFDEVLPVFKSFEDFDRGASEFHGAGGPFPVLTKMGKNHHT